MFCSHHFALIDKHPSVIPKIRLPMSPFVHREVLSELAPDLIVNNITMPMDINVPRYSRPVVDVLCKCSIKEQVCVESEGPDPQS